MMLPITFPRFIILITTRNINKQNPCICWAANLRKPSIKSCLKTYFIAEETAQSEGPEFGSETKVTIKGECVLEWYTKYTYTKFVCVYWLAGWGFVLFRKYLHMKTFPITVETYPLSLVLTMPPLFFCPIKTRKTLRYQNN